MTSRAEPGSIARPIISTSAIKTSLIEQTIDELLQEIFAGCAPVLDRRRPSRPRYGSPFVVQMFEQVGRRSELYQRLIGHGGSAYFIQRFQDRNEQLYLQVWQFPTRRMATAISPPVSGPASARPRS